MKIGDQITTSGGVNATDIPVGAIVRYSMGVDQKTGDYEVMMNKGGKMLGMDGIPLWIGYGQMTILGLPNTE